MHVTYSGRCMNFRSLQLAVFSLLLLPFSAEADDHAHEPLLVRSGPVIERVPLKVIHPVDLAVNEFDETFVADSVGKSLFRVSSDGDVSLLADDIENLSRVAFSKMGGIFALQATPRSARILRIDNNGTQSEFAHLRFTPTGLAADRFGNLWTANAKAGTVYRYSAEGDVDVSVDVGSQVIDLDVNSTGNAVVLLASGRVLNVFLDGTTTTAGFLPRDTQRIQLEPDGNLVGLVTEESGTSTLYRLGQSANDIPRFGRCIRGTTAFAFDRLGNLTAGSGDLRAITKMTSHFEVPCPHCGENVPMTFSKTAPGPQPKRHSF